MTIEGDATATAEGFPPNLGDMFGKDDRSEATAAVESAVTNLGDTVGKDERSEATAAVEGTFCDPVRMHPVPGRDQNRKAMLPVESPWKLVLLADAEVWDTPIGTCTRHWELDAWAGGVGTWSTLSRR
jgi:hypothetical protein